METIEIKDNKMETVKGNNKVELSNVFNILINEIKDNVYKETYYEIKNNDNLIKINLSSIDVDKKKIKRFRRYLNSFIKKRTLNSLNRLFFVAYKIIIGISDYPKIINTKHNNIQLKRKEWKKIQKMANDALHDYKVEKIDFYKKNPKYNKI